MAATSKEHRLSQHVYATLQTLSCSLVEGLYLREADSMQELLCTPSQHRTDILAWICSSICPSLGKKLPSLRSKDPISLSQELAVFGQEMMLCRTDDLDLITGRACPLRQLWFLEQLLTLVPDSVDSSEDSRAGGEGLLKELFCPEALPHLTHALTPTLNPWPSDIRYTLTPWPSDIRYTLTPWPSDIRYTLTPWPSDIRYTLTPWPSDIRYTLTPWPSDIRYTLTPWPSDIRYTLTPWPSDIRYTLTPWPSDIRYTLTPWPSDIRYTLTPWPSDIRYTLTPWPSDIRYTLTPWPSDIRYTLTPWPSDIRYTLTPWPSVLLHLHCLLFGVLGWVSVQHFEISADVRRAI
uniref:HAUS augmin-like complex subunit 7 n=1 Tax=Oncorhynchus kisutch TaxID=8019 RepID=A0A8C7KMB9_ONCKI